MFSWRANILHPTWNIWFENSLTVLFCFLSSLLLSLILWRPFLLTVWKRCPQTPTWDGGWQGTARSLSCTGEGWQTQLWLMTLRTTWKGRQRCHRGAVNPHSHLSERNMAGYIHNTLLEVKDFQIHLLVKHKTCIMNIHLLCSARVNEDPPLASWISSDSRAYLYSRWTLATLLSKYWQHKVDTGRRREREATVLPFTSPEILELGEVKHMKFWNEIEMQLAKKGHISHISPSSAAHSATFPRTEAFLKGTWKFGIIFPHSFVLLARCS